MRFGMLRYIKAIFTLPLRRKEAPRVRAYFNTFAAYRRIAAEPSFRAFPRRVSALFRVKKNLAGHAFFPKPSRNCAAGAGIPASVTIAASGFIYRLACGFKRRVGQYARQPQHWAAVLCNQQGAIANPADSDACRHCLMR